MGDKKKKTYEEVMSEIKKENLEYYRDIASKCNGEEKTRVEAIVEMARFDEALEDNNEINVDGNNCICQFQNDMVLNANCIRNNRGEATFEKTTIKVAKAVKIKNTFITKTLELQNYDGLPLKGRIVFEDSQAIDMLHISNIGVKGKFKTSRVVIKGITYLDLDLDINKKSDCCYLAIEPNKKNIRGKINMSEEFYNQLTSYNRKYLSYVISRGAIKLWIDDIPYREYEYEKKVDRKILSTEKNEKENIYNELKDTIRSIYEK